LGKNKKIWQGAINNTPEYLGRKKKCYYTSKRRKKVLKVRSRKEKRKEKKLC
jgi:hypothetical protein